MVVNMVEQCLYHGSQIMVYLPNYYGTKEDAHADQAVTSVRASVFLSVCDGLRSRRMMGLFVIIHFLVSFCDFMTRSVSLY